MAVADARAEEDPELVGVGDETERQKTVAMSEPPRRNQERALLPRPPSGPRQKQRERPQAPERKRDADEPERHQKVRCTVDVAREVNGFHRRMALDERDEVLEPTARAEMLG